MPGTRKHLCRTRLMAALALTALIALPGCYARRSIPSDAPDDAPAVTPAATPTAAKPEAAKPEAPSAAAPAAPAEPAAPAAAATAAADNATAAAEAAQHAYYVQIGAFATAKNAEGAVLWLKDKGYAQTRVVLVEQQGATAYHRVQAGPYAGYAAARKVLEELKPSWPQAFIPGD
jgi:cell division septation protein DedD